MAHYVVCPQKKIISRIFKISGALIVKKCAPSPLNLRILSLTSAPLAFTLTTGQVPNLGYSAAPFFSLSAVSLVFICLLSAPFLPTSPVPSFILTESYVRSRCPTLLFCPPVSAHFSRPVFHSFFLTILTFFRFTYHILPVYLPHSSGLLTSFFRFTYHILPFVQGILPACLPWRCNPFLLFLSLVQHPSTPPPPPIIQACPTSFNPSFCNQDFVFVSIPTSLFSFTFTAHVSSQAFASFLITLVQRQASYVLHELYDLALRASVLAAHRRSFRRSPFQRFNGCFALTHPSF